MKKNIKLEQYQRLFQSVGLPYINIDVFMRYYKNLDCLSIFINNHWTSYIPKSTLKKTLKEGLTLYSNKNRFKLYSDEFSNYKNLSSKFFEKLIKSKKILKKDLLRFFNLTTKFFELYSKTEFIYIDKAFLKSKNNLILKSNLQEFENVKNSGREYLNKIFFSGAQGYLANVVKILSKQFKINLSTLKQYSIDEILDLFNGEKVNKDVIKRRKKAIIIQIEGKKIIRIDGKEAKIVLSKFLNEEKVKKEKIYGKIAYKGITRGRVKIMKSDYKKFDKLNEIIKKMKRGEILVAETTSPELIMACRKARAIVTNQGGLMSHAAIISRELKIPCIVGTGNATDLLKDGDLVEVDAEKGVVKILKKNA